MAWKRLPGLVVAVLLFTASVANAALVSLESGKSAVFNFDLSSATPGPVYSGINVFAVIGGTSTLSEYRYVLYSDPDGVGFSPGGGSGSDAIGFSGTFPSSISSRSTRQG